MVHVDLLLYYYNEYVADVLLEARLAVLLMKTAAVLHDGRWRAAIVIYTRQTGRFYYI